MTGAGFITEAAINHAGAMLLVFAAASATAIPAKCTTLPDEMNCVNATVGDLPGTVQEDVKDLYFLNSTLPLLKTGDLGNFPRMTDFVCLDCRMLFVEKDAFCVHDRLIRVALYGNDLTFLDPNLFEKCAKMKEFIVSWNPGLVIADGKPFLVSSTLIGLDLSGNELTELFSATFSKLPRLKSLNLAGNQLWRLPADVFVPLKKLRHLDLSRNRLTTASLSLFPNRVFKLRLSWNPWHCNCSLYPVMQWSRTREMDGEVRCFTPSRTKWTDFRAPECGSGYVEAIRHRKVANGENAR